MPKAIFENKQNQNELAKRPVGLFQRSWTLILAKNMPQFVCAHSQTLHMIRSMYSGNGRTRIFFRSDEGCTFWGRGAHFDLMVAQRPQTPHDIKKSVRWVPSIVNCSESQQPFSNLKHKWIAFPSRRHSGKSAVNEDHLNSWAVSCTLGPSVARLNVCVQVAERLLTSGAVYYA